MRSFHLHAAMLCVILVTSSGSAADRSASPAEEQSGVKEVTPNGRPGAAPVAMLQTEVDRCIRSPESVITGHETPAQIRVKIDSTGTPTTVLIETSSGSKELDHRIADCYRKARYRPAVLDGKRVSSDLVLLLKLDELVTQTTCGPATLRGPTVRVGVTASSTLSEPLPSTGMAILCQCSTDGGEVEHKIQKSSGNAHFDEGALQMMKDTVMKDAAVGKKWSGPPGCVAYRFEFTTHESASQVEK